MQKLIVFALAVALSGCGLARLVRSPITPPEVRLEMKESKLGERAQELELRRQRVDARQFVRCVLGMMPAPIEQAARSCLVQQIAEPVCEALCGGYVGQFPESKAEPEPEPEEPIGNLGSLGGES